MPQCVKVLFVDDEQAVLDSLRRGLCRAYDVTTARGPEEGLCAVRNAGPFAVVVSDLRMPGMDGVQFLKKVHEISPLTVGIMLTGHGDLTAAMDAVNEGHIFRFLTKPCPIPCLSQALDAGLDQYRLVAAEKQLLRVTLENARLKEDVERIMRHDLKSPLGTVITLPQLLLMDDNLTDAQRDMLGRIEDAGYTLLAMINLSTTLFRMERGSYELAPEDMDLAAVARKVLAGFSETAEMRRIDLRLLVDGREEDARVPFRGEELLCHSMLANLVGNALDASPRGGTVRVRMESSEGVRIDIVNAGDVPPRLRERFFEKYATAGKSRGTGLGTYSARLIARAHGGDIAMACGGGEVTVSVRLPD